MLGSNFLINQMIFIWLILEVYLIKKKNKKIWVYFNSPDLIKLVDIKQKLYLLPLITIVL